MCEILLFIFILCLFLIYFLRLLCCGPFLKSSLNLLQYCFCFMFWVFGQEACKILAPWPGLEPASPTLEGEGSTMRPLEKSWVYWGSKHHSSISTECPCLLSRKKAGHHRQFKITCVGTSLVIQWWRLCASNARAMGLIPGQELRSHVLYGMAKSTPLKQNQTQNNMWTTPSFFTLIGTSPNFLPQMPY